MAAIVRQYTARSESNASVGASHPDQLPSNYMYPTSIDDDVAFNSQTSTQGQPSGQIKNISNQQGSGAPLSGLVASPPGASMSNGYHLMASNPSQTAPRQPQSNQRRTSQHARASDSRNNPQLSRRARARRMAMLGQSAPYDHSESTDEES